MKEIFVMMILAFLQSRVDASIRIQRFVLQQKSEFLGRETSIFCEEFSNIKCAVKCAYIRNCLSFSVGPTKTWIKSEKGLKRGFNGLWKKEKGSNHEERKNTAITSPANTDECPSALPTEMTTRDASDGDLDYNLTLHEACKEGKICTVKYILSKKLADINCRGKFGRTSVMVSAINGKDEVFSFLVTQGCDLTAVDDYNDTIIHLSSEAGRTDMIKKLIVKHKYDIDCRGANGSTPVMRAVYAGHINVFELLRSRGCNLTSVDDFKNSILHAACSGGHIDTVKHILPYCMTQKESRGEYGRTPVMMAAKQGHRKVIEFLASKGLNLTVVDTLKDNILHIACLFGHFDTVKYILRHSSISIESKGQLGSTPILMAASNGNIQTIDFLVSKGCKVTAVDTHNNNILHVACSHGQLHIVKYIVSRGMTSIESKGQMDCTPVMKAARFGHIQIIHFLVSKGCKLTAVNVNKDNSLHLASRSGHIDVVKYILSKGIISKESRGHNGNTPLLTTAEVGWINVFDFLVSQGCSLMAVNDYHDTILHEACRWGQIMMIKDIISRNIFDIDTKGNQGRTPLMKAALYGQERVVKLLVFKGCNLRTTDARGNNILHLASNNGNTGNVRFILSKAKSYIESRDKFGCTPVMMAAKHGHLDTFMLLVGNGCSLKTRDDMKNNILHWACIGGNIDVVKYILSQNIVSLESRGLFKRTPVMMAAQHGHKEIVKLLVRKGINLKAVDDTDNTILHRACHSGSLDMVRYLIKLWGGGRKKRNKYGRTPAQEAMAQKHSAIVALLKSTE